MHMHDFPGVTVCRIYVHSENLFQRCLRSSSVFADTSNIFDDRSKVLWCLLVLAEHFVKGVVKLARDRIDLQLLPDDLVLQLVDPMRQYQEDGIGDCGDGGEGSDGGDLV